MAKADSGFGFIPANMVVSVGEEARQERKKEIIPITMTQCPNKLWEIDARGKSIMDLITAFPTIWISCLFFSEKIQDRFGLKSFVPHMTVNLISGLASSLNFVMEQHGDELMDNERKLMADVMKAFEEFAMNAGHYTVHIERAGGPNV